MFATMLPSASRLFSGRASVLRHIRIPGSPPHCVLDHPSLLSVPFSANAHNTFLNKNEVADRVLKVLKHFQNIDPSKVSLAAHFQSDLGLDSLDTVEVVMALEEEFTLEIPDKEADNIKTCSAAIDFIASHPMAK